MIHTRRTRCRACGSWRLQRVLSLGPTPLANAFLQSEQEFATEPSYPLDLYFCATCSLVQLLDVIDPEVLFRHYIYVTGTSDTIAAHNARYAQTVVERLGLGSDDLVIEVASNDGSLLRCFQPYGVRTLGIEPAVNIAALARAFGVETVNVFLNPDTAEMVREQYGGAAAVIGNNVLAHVDDPVAFLSACRRLLRPDGQIIIEVPYVRDMLDRLEYDTIYHEHHCYFSVTTLLRLCDATGLALTQIDYVPVHGGSLRMYASIESGEGHSPAVLALAAEEETAGLTRLSRYERFAADVAANRDTLLDLLETLRRQGKTVAGYGAPAKGNTLLNYCGIDTRLVAYTVDKNPLKVGMYTPGMHLPVRPVSTLLETPPAYVLILAWNFADEIMRQQREYAARGGKFILPIPELKVV